jgi:CRP-like cAMP-binding protein
MAAFKNTVLTALGAEAEKLTKRGALVNLPFGETVYEAGGPLNYVYFPEGCLLSLVRSTPDGQTTESGLCGYEGALGFLEACGSRTISATTVVQVPGPAWRVRHGACRALVGAGGRAAEIAFAAAEFQLIEARQSALCRSFHLADARLARWLLEYRKRSAVADAIPITQEFLAAMLGVQRTTVTAIARDMKASGVISYSRGQITVKDVAAVERMSCDCGEVLDQERERLRDVITAPAVHA